MSRSLFAIAAGLAFLSHSFEARAQTCGGPAIDGGGDAGVDASDDAGDDASDDGGHVATCAENQYCALPGAILDGGAGVCAPEPCVVASDCPNDEICDTSQNPFACVQCISGADCPGDLVCDTANHTCVNPPPVPDASAEDASSNDAGDAAADAGTDAGPPAVDASVDAGTTDAGPASDASDASANEGPPQTDYGSLDGGAWDCAMAAAREMPGSAFALAGGIAALFFLRRNGRKKRG